MNGWQSDSPEAVLINPLPTAMISLSQVTKKAFPM
jgi:hypothetical protein